MTLIIRKPGDLTALQVMKIELANFLKQELGKAQSNYDLSWSGAEASREAGKMSVLTAVAQFMQDKDWNEGSLL